MNTTTTTSRPRQRKPLQPVQVAVEHFVYNRTLGLGTLDIVAADTPETYLLTAHRDRDRLLGMRFLKLSTGVSHDLDLTVTPWRCDCGDATHRPDRPGGCRHLAALRQAADQLRGQAAEPAATGSPSQTGGRRQAG